MQLQIIQNFARGFIFLMDQQIQSHFLFQVKYPVIALVPSIGLLQFCGSCEGTGSNILKGKACFSFGSYFQWLLICHTSTGNTDPNALCETWVMRGSFLEICVSFLCIQKRRLNRIHQRTVFLLVSPLFCVQEEEEDSMNNVE